MSLNLMIKKSAVGGAVAVDITVDVDTSTTVLELKEQIATRVELPVENIRLVCAGRVWDNVATVASYGPGAATTVHCLNNPPRVTPATSQTLTAANPMQQMMASAMPLQADGNDDQFGQMMAQTQQQLMQNPELMQQLMSSPMVQQMMSNPETLRGMMRMNPRMNQLMEERPEVARMLEDPEMIQQSMRMMSNPSLMREMTRNQDRAMGQLDTMPGGHQALVRAHEEYTNPLLNAMSNGGGVAGAASLPMYEDSVAAPNNDALPNPWGPPPASTPVNPSTPAASPAPSVSAFTPPAPANPMHQMMQQMMSNPVAASSPAAIPAVAEGPQAANPMQQMMQQMMSNPAMMQQAMSMRQHMMQQQNQPQGQHPTANPFQTMMQQMNPGIGQNSGGNPPVYDSSQRARFASQLVQLTNMGFTDETTCLQALAQHNGRLDAAIDVLLAGNGP